MNRPIQNTFSQNQALASITFLSIINSQYSFRMSSRENKIEHIIKSFGLNQRQCDMFAGQVSVEPIRMIEYLYQLDYQQRVFLAVLSWEVISVVGFTKEDWEETLEAFKEIAITKAEYIEAVQSVYGSGVYLDIDGILRLSSNSTSMGVKKHESNSSGCLIFFAVCLIISFLVSMCK